MTLTTEMIAREDKIVMSVTCHEKNKFITRTVRPTRLSYEKLQFLWSKMKEFDTLFNDYTKGDFRAFFEHFVQKVDGEILPTGLMWDVDDVGMFMLNELRPGESAEAHFIFWDLRFRGREELCREMLKYVFEKYKFRRISIRVPLYSTHTLNAVDRIGFVKEGRLRKAILYKDDWFDVNIYSILPEDLETHFPDRRKLSTRNVCLDCGKGYFREVSDNGTVYFKEEPEHHGSTD